MALQVWLPLNRDLRNNGVSDLTFSSSGVSLSAAGKMGSCYTKGTSTGWILSDKKIYLGKNQSMFCWVKPTSFNSDASLTGVTGQHRYKACLNMGITLKYASSTSGYVCINTGSGNGRTYNAYAGSTLLTAGNWYHVGYTYDGTTVKLYVNGNLDKSYTITDMAFGPDYIQCFNWSLGDGNAVYTGYSLNGSLNDVRIYDHTLSTKEIKEIAKGKMLHWTFNEGGYGGVSNYFPYPTPGTTITPGWDVSLHPRAISVSGWSNGYNSGVTNSSGTKDPGVGYHAHWELIDNIPTMVFPKLNSKAGTNPGRWLGISESGQNHWWDIGPSMTYTVSFDAMADSEGREVYGGYYYSIDGANRGFHDGSFYAKNIPVGEWKRYSFTFTTRSDMSSALSAYFYFYGMNGSDGIAYVRNMQLEWSPQSGDYTPGSQKRATLITDSSGFGHNGTITGTLESAQSNVNTNVKDGATRNYENKDFSARFNGGSYVCYDTQMAIPDAFTIAFWINKSSDGHVIDWRALSGEAGVQPVYLGGKKIQYYSSAGGSAYFDYVFSDNV